MAKKIKDEDVLRFARGTVTESSNSTFTQEDMDTQLSVDRGFIWLIHFIEFHFENVELLSEVAAGANEEISAQITRSTQGSIIKLNDPDLIQSAAIYVSRSADINTDVGPLWYFGKMPLIYSYKIPIPYAGSRIFIGILGTDAATPHIVGFRIGYTTKEVSNQYFFRVAQALVG